MVFTLTCPGRLAAQWMASAMSSAVIGCIPVYTLSALARSPPNLTSENSVSAMPGSTQVTLTPVPCRSLRRFRLNW
jgi:hypothetical protein